MATRGYFKILNGDDPNRPYQTTRDLWVEAYHDGYTEGMVEDILRIPFTLAQLLQTLHQTLEHSPKYVTFHLFPPEWDDHEPPKSFEKLLESNNSLGFFGFMWSSVLELLQFTCFAKYQEVDPGVVRYGHPTTEDDLDFTVKTEEGPSRDDITTITMLRAPEGWHGHDLTELVAELNSRIQDEPSKIQYDETAGTIVLNLTRITLDQMFQASQKS